MILLVIFIKNTCQNFFMPRRAAILNRLAQKMEWYLKTKVPGRIVGPEKYTQIFLEHQLLRYGIDPAHPDPKKLRRMIRGMMSQLRPLIGDAIYQLAEYLEKSIPAYEKEWAVKEHARRSKLAMQRISMYAEGKIPPDEVADVIRDIEHWMVSTLASYEHLPGPEKLARHLLLAQMRAHKVDPIDPSEKSLKAMIKGIHNQLVFLIGESGARQMTVRLTKTLERRSKNLHRAE